MATFSKQKLSASTDGMGINITATATPGTTVHTAHATALDEIWLYVANIGAQAVKLTLEYGGATTTDNIEINVSGEVGLMLVLPGLLLTNSKVLKAFAGTTAVLTVYGFVNRIT